MKQPTFTYLILKAIAYMAMSFFIGALLAVALGAVHEAPIVGLLFALLCLIPQGKNLKGSFLSIVAADVVTEFGLLFREQGQGFNDIVLKLQQKSVTAGYFPTRLTNNTKLEKVSAEFARVLQRFQKGYTPIGSTTFEPMTIQLYKLKIDLAETPDDLEESWLGFMADQNLDRRQWPFIKWYLMNALIQADKDLELNEIYAGVPGSITPGTATAAGTSLLGIRKQINDLDADSKLLKIVLGAVPTDPSDFVDYVEAMFEATPVLLRNEIDFIFMSQDLRNRFRDGMRVKFNTYYNQVDDKSITTLRNYPVQIIGLPSMAGATKIWYTPPWNRQMGFKKPGNEKIFQVENVDRLVKAYTDYFKGFGFWIGEYVVSNDVELT